LNKKIITILLSFFLFTFFVRQGCAQVQQRAQDPSSHDEETYVPGESGIKGKEMGQDETSSYPVGNQDSSRGVGNSAQGLNRIITRANNPEVGNQVRTMVEAHEVVQKQVQTALNKMESRPAYLKFLIGPDYKTAIQLRSNIAGLRNDISQLTNLKKDLGLEDSEDIESAIAELQAKAGILEAQLTDQLSGISLFGWLSKLISNY